MSLKKFADLVKEKLGVASNEGAQRIKKVGEKVEDKVEEVKEEIKETATNAGTALRGVAEAMEAKAAETAEDVREMEEKAVETIKSARQAMLEKAAETKEKVEQLEEKKKAADIEAIAKEVIQGKWGNGQERKDRLTAAGYDYSTIQGKVNDILHGTDTKKKTGKSTTQIAKEVIQGKWGNGAERKKRLTDAGYDYSKVQAKVNELLHPKK